MAKHSYRLLDEAINRQADFVGDKTAGDEFDHDFGQHEKAVIAAGWVERTDAEAADDEAAKKGGRK